MTFFWHRYEEAIKAKGPFKLRFKEGDEVWFKEPECHDFYGCVIYKVDPYNEECYFLNTVEWCRECDVYATKYELCTALEQYWRNEKHKCLLNKEENNDI